jgi:CxxC motif-containing protein (DUF1111 family)
MKTILVFLALAAVSALIGLIVAGAEAQVGGSAKVLDNMFQPSSPRPPGTEISQLFREGGAVPHLINPPGTDPGVRTGAAGAGGFFSTLSSDELAFANAASFWFGQPWTVTGGSLPGLGPRFNTNGCFQCHAYPAQGGSSPIPNNEVAQATLLGATNTVPSFITSSGPTRIPHQPSTDGLLKLYTIAGRSDASGCTSSNILQPDFAALLASNDLSYHIPVPLFGVGLVEGTPSANLIAAQTVLPTGVTWTFAGLGITTGRFNQSADGIATIGWKGAASSVEYFAALALAVELDVTTQIFPRKGDEVSACIFNNLPEDGPQLVRRSPNTSSVSADYASSQMLDAQFARYLAPPTPASSGYTSSVVGTVTSGSIANGQQQFINVGCVACHTQTQTTGAHVAITGQSSQPYTPWSDYALHDMGTGLRDGITQGAAGPQDFRTAALWGAGQRHFFMHDGRETDLNAAIQDHSSTGSEANQTVINFNALSTANQQDVLNFLRAQ